MKSNQIDIICPTGFRRPDPSLVPKKGWKAAISVFGWRWHNVVVDQVSTTEELESEQGTIVFAEPIPSDEYTILGKPFKLPTPVPDGYKLVLPSDIAVGVHAVTIDKYVGVLSNDTLLVMFNEDGIWHPAFGTYSDANDIWRDRDSGVIRRIYCRKVKK